MGLGVLLAVGLGDWLSIRLKAWAAAGPSGPFGGHATLTNGLVSYWTLDEASGTRADSVGSNDLTDNNTVGNVAGVFNDAANFISANSESLLRSSQITDWQGEWTIATWFKQSTEQNHELISIDSNLRIFVNSSDIRVYLNGFPEPIQSFSPTTDWHFLIVTKEDAGGGSWDYGISIDGSTLAIDASLHAQLGSSGSVFWVGRYFGSAINFFDGLVDELGVWSRVLTIDERTDIYNGGAGLFYGS